jgi:hypothetical protein
MVHQERRWQRRRFCFLFCLGQPRSLDPFPAGPKVRLGLIDRFSHPPASTTDSPKWQGHKLGQSRARQSQRKDRRSPAVFLFGALAASLANRSALSRSRFLRSAICSFSCSVSGLSDGRNMLLASFSRLLMAELSHSLVEKRPGLGGRGEPGPPGTARRMGQSRADEPQAEIGLGGWTTRAIPPPSCLVETLTARI